MLHRATLVWAAESEICSAGVVSVLDGAWPGCASAVVVGSVVSVGSGSGRYIVVSLPDVGAADASTPPPSRPSTFVPNSAASPNSRPTTAATATRATSPDQDRAVFLSDTGRLSLVRTDHARWIRARLPAIVGDPGAAQPTRPHRRAPLRGPSEGPRGQCDLRYPRPQVTARAPTCPDSATCGTHDRRSQLAHEPPGQCEFSHPATQVSAALRSRSARACTSVRSS